MPLAKILLATDGSPEAASTARMAITLSRSLGGELHVVYVGVAPSAYAASESEILDYEFWKELRAFAQNEASQSVEEEVRKIEGAGGKIEMVHVAVGHPESEILRIAEEIGADLVVVGSRGLGPLRRALMGSVSESVVRHAHCSVLVVRGQDRDGGYLPGRVLLALEGSRGAGEAERSAAEISAATGSVLDIVRVLEAELYRPYPGPEYWEGWEADVEHSKRQVEAFLDERAQSLRAEGIEVGDAHLALGDPDKEIVRFAEDEHDDLIILGSRELGRLKHCLRSRNYVNLIAIDKQPQLQWLSMEAAIEHLVRGAATWEWASNVPEGQEPDVVLGCAGDIPTLETVAAAHWLRENAPELRIRVVNVVDLMALFPREFHPHGMDETRFVELFTANRPVVFAFHGYQRAIHEIVHGHVDVDRFHVRGFNEQGTTTTPFDMTVLNGMSRYHLAAEALRRSGESPGSRLQDRTPTLVSECETLIAKATAYSQRHLIDAPEIRDWRWTS